MELHLHKGTSEQIAEMVKHGRIDFAIATGTQQLFPEHVLLPVYPWHRRIVVPRNHPLAQIHAPSLEDLAKYPLVTYVFSFSGPSSLTDAFARAGLVPRIALTARDSDVVKTYVRLGLGVGIIAGMALDPKEDQDLVAIEATHLFPVHTTWVGFFRDGLLRQYMYDFLQILAPHLTRRIVDRAVECESPESVTALFAREPLPVR